MPLIDDRGRVFGRLNIIDAALLAFVLVLLPIGYTATRLFRVRPPVIQSVTPVSQPIAQPGSGPRRVTLHGQDFRPYLKAFVGPSEKPLVLFGPNSVGVEGRLLAETPSSVELVLPDLKPGHFDVYLYDETQQVAHLANAFTLIDDTPPPIKPREWVGQVTVRFALIKEVLRLVHEGDQDARDHADDPKEPVATLRRLRVLGDEPLSYVEIYGWGAKIVEAEFDVPIRENAKKEWEYRSRTIRTGDMFFFGTPQYALASGFIGNVKISPPTPAADKVGGAR